MLNHVQISTYCVLKMLGKMSFDREGKNMQSPFAGSHIFNVSLTYSYMVLLLEM